MPSARHLAISLPVVWFLIGAPAQAATTSKPNVLVIVADDLGFGDLSCQGAADMNTPNLDQLFADSLRLNRFYANCPVCSPTRASVLTGCYPDRVGVPGVIRTMPENSWGYFSPSSPTLPQRLGKLGYQTGAVGKWHLGLREENHPNSRGFDHFQGFLGDMMDDYYNHRRHNINYMRSGRDEIDPTGHATDLFSQWGVEFVSARADSAQPWFLYLAYNAPHTPIQPPQDWLEKVKAREDGMSDKRAALVALIEHLDSGIGEVLDALRQTGQYDNTVIVFTSDNGGQISAGANNGPLRDGKQSMYEGGLRIPACLHVPERTKPGSSTDAVASTVDLLPTLVEFAGGNRVVDTDGKSLAVLADDPNADWPTREIYFVRREGGTQYAGLTIEAVLYGDYKLVHNLPTSELELFNLTNDPMETTNLAKREGKQFRDMINRLQRHTQRGGQIPWQKKE